MRLHAFVEQFFHAGRSAGISRTTADVLRQRLDPEQDQTYTTSLRDDLRSVAPPEIVDSAYARDLKRRAAPTAGDGTLLPALRDRLIERGADDPIIEKLLSLSTIERGKAMLLARSVMNKLAWDVRQSIEGKQGFLASKPDDEAPIY